MVLACLVVDIVDGKLLALQVARLLALELAVLDPAEHGLTCPVFLLFCFGKQMGMEFS